MAQENLNFFNQIQKFPLEINENINQINVNNNKSETTEKLEFNEPKQITSLCRVSNFKRNSDKY